MIDSSDESDDPNVRDEELKSGSIARGSHESGAASPRSAAAITTDDPDCLRLQDSSVLFSSEEEEKHDDDDVAPKRRRKSSDQETASVSAQKTFERIVDSLPENLRANWSWLRQRRVCFRQLELGHCKYKDKYVSRLTASKCVSTFQNSISSLNPESEYLRRSKKDWLCDKTHAGIEAEDVMQYLDLISNACPEELPNLLRFNGDDRVLRIMAIYHINKVSKQCKTRHVYPSAVLYT